MSRNQKAPLLAFVFVALVCGLILVDALRGNASGGRDVGLDVSDLSGPAGVLAPISSTPEPSGLPSPSEPTAESDGGLAIPSEVGISVREGAARLGSEPIDDAPTPPTVAADETGELPAWVAPGSDPGDPGLSDGLTGLWPPSVVPGMEDPIVGFPNIGPDDDPMAEPSGPGTVSTPDDDPSVDPSESEEPSEDPSEDPSESPTGEPSEDPTEGPSEDPSEGPGPSDGPEVTSDSAPPAPDPSAAASEAS